MELVAEPVGCPVSHCKWCSTGTKARIVSALREDSEADLRVLSETLSVGYWYAAKVQTKARRLGCLRFPDPMPPPPRPVAWTLPPIGAVYLTETAAARGRPR